MRCQMSCGKILIYLCISFTAIIVLYWSRFEAVAVMSSYISVNLDRPSNTVAEEESGIKTMIKIQEKTNITIQKELSEPTKINPDILLQEDLDLAARTLMSTEQKWLPKMIYQTIEHTMSGFERAKLVQERCHLLKQNRNNYEALRKYSIYESQSFIVHRNLNVTFCINCKVASSSTKIFLSTFDKQPSGWRNARLYAETLFRTGEQALSYGFMNITFVREPLERLLSAYRDNKGFTQYADFSFEVFLNLTLKSKKTTLNRHIFPYTLRCLPCYINYNFVGMQATFDADIAAIMKKQHIPKNRYNTPDRGDLYTKHSEDKLNRYYRNIPKETIHKLWEMYYLDYFVFGFPYPSHLMKK